MVRLCILQLMVCTIANAGEYAERYSRQIEKLDRTRPESACQARMALRAQLPAAGAIDRAAMFRAYRSLYLEAIGRTSAAFAKAAEPVTAQIEQLRPIYRWDSVKEIALLSAQPEIHRAIGPWLECGFSITTEEGAWFPVPSSVVMIEFVSKLPPALAACVRFRAHEDAEAVAGDATLGLTWRQLGERLLRWEDFARLHPGLIEIEPEIKPEIRILSGMFLFGVDNTPTFIESKIDPKLVAAWRWYIGRNPRPQFAPLIREILEALDLNDYKLTSKHRELFARYGLREEFDGWLRNMGMRTP